MLLMGLEVRGGAVESGVCDTETELRPLNCAVATTLSEYKKLGGFLAEISFTATEEMRGGAAGLLDCHRLKTAVVISSDVPKTTATTSRQFTGRQFTVKVFRFRRNVEPFEEITGVRVPDVQISIRGVVIRSFASDRKGNAHG